jgi:hypothetical protein
MNGKFVVENVREHGRDASSDFRDAESVMQPN